MKAPKVSFHSFTEDKSICVVHSIKEYIDRTSPWREQNKESSLFLSLLNPHHSVSSKRWLKQVLNESGINTSLFTAHSTRAASSSKAKVNGAKFEDILDRMKCIHDFICFISGNNYSYGKRGGYR